MTTHNFVQLDVFNNSAFSGNPLAVIADADDLDTETMQSIARWTGLSETAFLCTPTGDGAEKADYRVRIFTPTDELPFAGHPTLGSAVAWSIFTNSDKTDMVQQCQAGNVRVQKHDDLYYFAAPELQRTGPLDDNTLGTIVRSLGISHYDIVDHGWGDNGPGWALIQLNNANAVRRIRSRTHGYVQMGVFGFENSAAADSAPAVGNEDENVIADASNANTDEPIMEVRALYGSHEDPVTGSLNAAIAQFLHAKGAVPRHYTAKQGSCRGFDGRIRVDIESDDTIWVGGKVGSIISGTIEI